MTKRHLWIFIYKHDLGIDAGIPLRKKYKMPVKVHLAKKVSLKKSSVVVEREAYNKRMYDTYPFVTGSETIVLMDFFQENLKNNDLRVLAGFFKSGLIVR